MTTNVKQMMTVIERVPTTLDEIGEWIQVGLSLNITTTPPTTPESDSGVLAKPTTTRLTALLVAECVGAISLPSDFTDRSTPFPFDFEDVHRHALHQHAFAIHQGVPFDVRITVDGEPTLPPFTQFVGAGIRIASHSFLAVKDDVSVGNHTVAVGWRARTTPGAVMENRTLTVWETVIEKPLVVASD